MTKAAPSPIANAATVEIRSDVVCMGCGCLCDDVSLGLQAGSIESFDPECGLGRRWFESNLAVEPIEALVRGSPSSLEESVQGACSALQQAKNVLFLGLQDCSIEAQQRIVELARRIGATVRPGSSDAVPHAVARVGAVTGTLGEAKLRSDVVVFWMCDPVVSHPRHLERYSVDPKSSFLPNGRADRKVLVAYSQPNATSQIANLSLAVDPDREIELLQTFRAMLKGARLDRSRVGRLTGLAFETLEDWTKALVSARHGSLFWTSRLNESEARLEALHKLVDDLNQGRRFLAIPLGSADNEEGARAVGTWKGGYASTTRFTFEDSEALPQNAKIPFAGFDVVVAFGESSFDSLTTEKRPYLIQISPKATSRDGKADLAIRTPRLGIGESGTIMRADGAMLPLQAPFVTTHAKLDEILSLLESRLPKKERG